MLTSLAQDAFFQAACGTHDQTIKSPLANNGSAKLAITTMQLVQPKATWNLATHGSSMQQTIAKQGLLFCRAVLFLDVP